MLNRAKSWWQIAIGLAGGLLGAGLLSLLNTNAPGQPIELQAPPSPAPIMVHVSGAVTHPDVYLLPSNSRVQDAIDAAGGLLPDADTQNLNLAAALNDEQKLLIPTLGDESGQSNPNPTAGFPVNINTASLQALDTLPGIGPVRAQAIISYREINGPYTSLEQIQNVSGIGPSTFENLKELIVIE